MNEILRKIQQEILKSQKENPSDEYKEGVKDGYISGLLFAAELLKAYNDEVLFGL